MHQVTDMRYLVFRLQTSEKIYSHPMKELFPGILTILLAQLVFSRILPTVLWTADKDPENSLFFQLITRLKNYQVNFMTKIQKA